MPPAGTPPYPCPSELCGVWKQDASRCESLCPLLEGLGMPKALLYIACPIADRTRATLKISCPKAGWVSVVDKTTFGRNETLVPLDGTETEKLTKGRKKSFMLSTSGDAETCVLHCRLSSRGPGWYTRQERFLSKTERDKRGEPMMVERHVLVRPDLPDVVLDRHFWRDPDNKEDLRPAPGETM